MNSQLQQTLDAAQGGLTSIDPATAAANVRSWQATLSGANFPGAQQLNSDLSQLATALESGDLTGAGPLLSRLGSSTSSAASAAPSEDQDGLQQLGSALSDAGSQL